MLLLKRRQSVGFRGVALAASLLVACDPAVPTLPGEKAPPTPCGRVIEGCTARRLKNIVLRGGEEDGAFGSIDGLDASQVIGFDEALAAAGANDLLGDVAETVQVVLGAANADERHWGKGGIQLFYAVKWNGVELPCFGPSGCQPPQFGTWASVIDATTGRWIVSGG
jgi:hypothetical protein